MQELATNEKAGSDGTWELGGVRFRTGRPHRFGLVIEGVVDAEPGTELAEDYLHAVLLAEANRDAFFGLIEDEGLVVCRNVRREHATYRPVAGKSSPGRLSQAEYYHHDGCSGPAKPRFDEIRLPWGAQARRATTAVARFGDVVTAQLAALPESMVDAQVQGWRDAFASPETCPPVAEWDTIQGRVTRRVRKELDAAGARAWFAEVDQRAGAYLLPWQPGESRLMVNDHADRTRTMQHRRAEPAVRAAGSATASLVKRWTAEELP